MSAESKKPVNDGYRFERFRAHHALRDMRFSRRALRPGQVLPDVELVTADGEAINATDLIGHRPVLIVTGSLTCPMTVSSLPQLKRLYSELGDRVAFVLLYTREAHPGENYPQPHRIEDKLEHARAMRDVYGLNWPVVVDDLDGTLHRVLDSKPNAAYLLDESGTVVFRALWAGHIRGLGDAVRRVARGEAPRRAQTNALFRPLARALGYISEVVDRAGTLAWRDLLIAAPPMWIVGKVTGLLQSVGQQKRGLGLTAAAAFVAALSVIGAILMI